MTIEPYAYPGVTFGEGYAVGSLDHIGFGHGFRKVRRALGVTAFGVNALVRPPGYLTKWHYHDVQEELYFVHKGAIEIEFGDGTTHRMEEGWFARVDASTVRRIRVLGPRRKRWRRRWDDETIYVCVGGRDGYVGHDGRTPEGMEQARQTPQDAMWPHETDPDGAWPAPMEQEGAEQE